MVISHDDIQANFFDVQEMSNGILKFQEIVPAFTDFYYLRPGSNRDLLMVSEGFEDDAFAASVIKAALMPSRNVSGLCKHPLDKSNVYDFTHFLLAPADYHSYFKGRLDPQREQLVLCLPIHNCEFAGDESPDLFCQLRRDIVAIHDWRRPVTPRVLLRFDNPKTGSGTIGSANVPLKYSLLENEIRNLNGVVSGFIEIVSFRGDYAQILSPETNVFSFRRESEAEPRQMNEQDVQAEVLRFLTADIALEL